MNSFHLKIVTPEKIIFDGDADMVLVNTELGQLGILPHHTNLMAKIMPGETRVDCGGKQT